MASHLHLKPGSRNWHAVLAIPSAVRPTFGNKTQFDRSTKTSDRRQAERIAAKLVSAWRDEIDAASKKLESPLKNLLVLSAEEHARMIAADPMLYIDPADPAGSLVTAVKAVFEKMGGLSIINRHTLITTILDPVNSAPVNRKSTPFDQHLEDWKQATHLSGKTLAQAISEIQRFARMVSVPIEQLSGKHVEVWIEAMRAQGLSAITVKAAISKIMSYWKWMERHEFVQTNPFANRTIPDGRSAKEKHAAKRQGFTASELRRLVDVCQDRDLGCLILIAIHSGARRESIVTLTVSQIVTIRGIRCFHFDDKTEAGIRDTPIHSLLLLVIDQMIAGAENGYLFNAKARGQNRYSAGDRLGKAFTRLKQGLGFPSNLVFHSIRHSFAEQLKDLGCPISTIRDIIGHENSDVTSGYTKAASVETKLEWIEKLTYENPDHC